MINMLRKIFDSNPGRSTIALKTTCSDCGDDVILHITSTSGGFGVQGGALFRESQDGYFAKCSDCYKGTSKIKNLDVPKFARAH
jgi:thymidine kinase